MKDRRKFLHQLALLGISIPVSSHLDKFKSTSIRPVRKENIDWDEIRSHFLASSHKLINLNNGSAGNMPKPILDKYISYLYELNSFAPYTVNSNWSSKCKQNMLRLAQLINAKSGDLAFVRNTTEAVNLILWGLDWQKGDEIIKANWDYPFVDYSCEHIKANYGVTIRSIGSRIYELTDEEIVQLYRDQITDKTKLIVVTWITHREGMTLPLKDICTMAHEYGVKVLADGAHTIGQIDIDLNDTGVDYFACSLHKWLNTPLGSGIMYINKDLMPEHRPHISFNPELVGDPSKYDHLGTRTFQNLPCLGDALDYLELTGIQAKEQRLKELTKYWMDELSSINGVSMHTDPDRSCAVAAMSFKDVRNGKIKKILNEEFSVHVKTASYPDTSMLRISPNIYTSYSDLDVFIDGIKQISKRF